MTKESKKQPKKITIELLYNQFVILDQMVDFFGKDIQEVIQHMLTEQIPNYVAQLHKTIANFNATKELMARVKKFVERADNQQKIMEEITT